MDGLEVPPKPHRALLASEKQLRTYKDRARIWNERRQLLLDRLYHLQDDASGLLCIDAQEAMESLTVKPFELDIQVIAAELELLRYPAARPLKYYCCWAHLRYCLAVAIKSLCHDDDDWVTCNPNRLNATVNCLDFKACSIIAPALREQSHRTAGTIFALFEDFVSDELKKDARNFHAYDFIRILLTWEAYALTRDDAEALSYFTAAATSFACREVRNESSLSLYVNCVMPHDTALNIRMVLSEFHRFLHVEMSPAFQAAVIKFVFPWTDEKRECVLQVGTSKYRKYRMSAEPCSIQIRSDQVIASDDLEISTYSQPCSLEGCIPQSPNKALTEDGTALLTEVLWIPLKQIESPKLRMLEFWAELFRYYVWSGSQSSITAHVADFEHLHNLAKVFGALPPTLGATMRRLEKLFAVRNNVLAPVWFELF